MLSNRLHNQEKRTALPVTEKEYKFFAPIANAGGHFRSLRVPAPFRIERWKKAKILTLWRKIEHLPKWEIEWRIDRNFVVAQSGSTGHLLTGSVLAPAETSFEVHAKYLEPAMRPLEHWIRCVRLITGGHVEFAALYWYQEVEKQADMIYAQHSEMPVKDKPGTVNPYAVAKDNELLQLLLSPMKHEYIELAWDHWDESFKAHHSHIEFLQLMMALEALFNVGQHDIRYRISRSAAVLLGEDRENAEFYYDTVREAYDGRSQLVHTGKSKALDNINIWFLRFVVRCAIIELIRLDMPKDQVAAELTKLGFGCKEQLAKLSKTTQAKPRKS
jgi:hypothetical protein